MKNNSIVSRIQVELNETAQTMELLQSFNKKQDIPYQDVKLIELEQHGNYLLELYYPLEVFDQSVTQFIALLFGEMPYMRMFKALQFQELVLPETVYEWFKGPRFGARQVLERFEIRNAPLLMGIVKPSLDLNCDVFKQADRISKVLQSGIHGVKDDEIQGNLGKLNLDSRLALAADLKGYIPVINSDDILYLERALSDQKISMAMINASAIGFPLVYQLRNLTHIPLMSHLSMQGTYQGSFHPRLYAFLHRLFGCDAFIVGIGDSGYYSTTKDEERQMVEVLTSDLPIKKTLPVLAGGARPHNVEEIIKPYELMGIPYGLLFGTYIYGSEDGLESRAKHVVEAVENAKKVIVSGEMPN